MPKTMPPHGDARSNAPSCSPWLARRLLVERSWTEVETLVSKKGRARSKFGQG